MKTPASLLERLHQAGDQEAWSRLVELYLPLVCYWARRAGLQDADVADLSQEVFAILYRTLPNFEYDGSKSFRNWLRTVTLNKWRELQRRRSELLFDDAGGVNHVPGDAEDFWEAEHNSYLAARALQLMKSDFEERTWQACWAVVVEERPPAEVASDLGLSVAGVYAAKSRVLRRLRQELAGLL